MTPLKPNEKPKFHFAHNHKPRSVNLTTKTKPISCLYCSKSHFVHTCPECLNMSSQQRHSFVQKTNSCSNCLRTGHSISDCKSAECKICGAKHNSLLHDYFSKSQERRSSPSREVISASSHYSQASVYNALKNLPHMILSTAVVLIADSKGKFHKARAFLDNASQINLITSKLCQKLGCEWQHSKLSITGVGKCTTQPSGFSTFNIKSVNDNYA